MDGKITQCSPTIFVVFGATGDLYKKKIAPSLFALYEDGLLPEKCKIVAFARREFTDAEFRKYTFGQINSENKELKESFCKMISYSQGAFDEISGYKKLSLDLGKIDKSWSTCSNKLFYLAVPPKYYEEIFDNLYCSGLTIPCGGGKGWTRILVEKPFGNDLTHALLLEKKIQKYFKEEQIFRIDHYLAKETMQNILAFRFSNPIFVNVWNKKNIKNVEVSIYEKNDVSTRGAFYDGVGALRDVGQNHALQMLALALMEKPKTMSCKDVRSGRINVLKYLKRPSSFFLAQYEGYLKEQNVPLESATETYFSLSTKADGVPIRISCGKALNESRAFIKILFGDKKSPENEITFELQPREGIAVSLNIKKPGLTYNTSKTKFEFLYKESGLTGSKDAYTKVLYDAMLGDQTLFPSSEEIMAGWNFVMSILKARNKTKMHTYLKGADPENML